MSRIHLTPASSTALLIVLLGLGIRLYGLGWGLPDVYEEATPLKTAWEMWNWESPAGIDPNPHFFNYPSLIIYIHFGLQALMYALMKLGGLVETAVDYQVKYIIDATPWYIAGRLVSTLFALGAVFFTYLIGKRVQNVTTGLVAAFFLAVNAFFTERSQMIEVDVPLTFWTVCTLWAAIRITERPTLRNYAIAGIALGLATATKYTGVMLALPVVVAHLTAVRIYGGDGYRSLKNLLLTVVVTFLIFVITSPYVILDFRSFYSDFMTERKHMDIGHFGLGNESSVAYYLSALVDHLLGWLLSLAGFAGLVFFVFIRRNRSAFILAALLVPYIVVISLWSMHAERYLLPVLPVFLLLASGLVVRLISAAPDRFKSSRLEPTALALVLIVVSVPAIRSHYTRVHSYRDDPRLAARNWIELNIPSGSWLVTEPYGPDLFQAATILRIQPEARRPLMTALAGRPIYAIQTMQMYQTDPELSAPFYNLSLYEIADFVITSSSVRSRYEREPDRFPEQIRFYQQLDTQYEKVREFRPRDGGGPVQTLYHCLSLRKPFGQRPSVPAPPRFHDSAGIGQGRLGGFYFHIGLNYEVFSFTNEALESYDLALENPAPSGMTGMLVLRKTSCLTKLGRTHEIPAFLEHMISTTDVESVQTLCQQLLDQVYTGGHPGKS